jgi:uncharacterized protein
MIGTIINVIAIVIGTIVGMILKTKLPDRITSTIFHGIGLFTIFLGISMALKTNNFFLLILSIVIGSLIGSILDIDKHVNNFSEWLKTKVKSKNERFTEGFITAFLLYCMGSMAILGSIEEGLGNTPNLLLSKSVLDGFSSMALASSLGIGVMFSVIPLMIYQGGITLITSSIQNILTTTMINELSAVGGLILIGLGIEILEIKKLKLLNMIPSLIVVIILSYYFF